MEKKKNQKIIPRRMVRIDEDEEECLRRLAEPSHHHKVKHVKNSDENFIMNHQSRVFTDNNNNKVQDIHIIGDHDHDHYYLHEEKKVVTQMPNKEKKVMKMSTNNQSNNKLETKKSEDINESAEKFIQKFKQQLILQRLESIENVEKMLQRGL
ncbi:Hybrid signal transduction histidine kinase B [Bienertia sinuspersici]